MENPLKCKNVLCTGVQNVLMQLIFELEMWPKVTYAVTL